MTSIAGVSGGVVTAPDLPALPLAHWEATKDTLHLWAQGVGEGGVASEAPRNHWWQVPRDVDVREQRTRREPPDAGPASREAYSHEVISFGFWAGDKNMRAPTYYSYTAPEPPGLRERPLQPADAAWIEQGGGSLAVLGYESVRTSSNPRATLLAFLESAYQAGAALAGWDSADFESAWCPRPGERL